MSYRLPQHRTLADQRGFTIVELLIILITVCALVGVAFTTFVDVRKRHNNTERQQDIKALQEAIEDYYSQREQYPTVANINDQAWRTKNLKAITDAQLTDPTGKSALVVAIPTAKAYSYAPTTSSGTTCDNVTQDCLKYVLTATQQDAEAYSKNNYN